MSARTPDGVAVHGHVVADLVREETDHSFGGKNASSLESFAFYIIQSLICFCIRININLIFNNKINKPEKMNNNNNNNNNNNTIIKANNNINYDQISNRKTTATSPETLTTFTSTTEEI